jgi:hypothetical protein
MVAKKVPIDLSLVKPGWNVKTVDTKWSPSADAITKRAREARRFIRDRVLELQKNGEPNPEVVVTTHGSFLHYFTEDWEDVAQFNGKSLIFPFTILVPCFPIRTSSVWTAILRTYKNNIAN